MSKILAKWMGSFLAVLFMLTPILAHVNALSRSAVDEVMHQYIREAAVEGRFTDEIIDDMQNELVSRYNFNEGAISFNVTESTTYRPSPTNTGTPGDEHYIEASITVPQTPIFLLYYPNGEDTFTRDARVMSEYTGP